MARWTLIRVAFARETTLPLRIFARELSKIFLGLSRPCVQENRLGYFTIDIRARKILRLTKRIGFAKIIHLHFSR